MIVDIDKMKQNFARRTPVKRVAHESILAAFKTRKYPIYSKTYSPDNDRREMREYMQAQLEGIAEQYVNVHVGEEAHIKNICIFADAVSNKYGYILQGKQFRIGITQKTLNLYLKYMWCHGKIKRPPHCPFDGVIISKLNLTSTPWTAMTRIEGYKEWVNAAEQKKDHMGCRSLAEWELIVWEICS